MRLIEIKSLSNGAHRNLTTSSLEAVPEGWALIPDEMECGNFPFGEVEAEVIEGKMTVTKWVPGVIPEPEPVPEPEPEPEAENISAADMAAAIKEGVNEI